MKTSIIILLILIQGFSVNSFAQRRANHTQRAIKHCKSIFEYKEMNKLGSFCKNYQVRNFFANLQKLNGEYVFHPSHDNYFQCLVDLSKREDYQDKSSPITCVSSNFREALKKKKITSCLEKIPDSVSMDSKWHQCQKSHLRDMILKSSYISCIEKMKEINQSHSVASNKCQSKNFRGKMKTYGIVDCMKHFPYGSLFSFDQKLNSCTDYTQKNKLKSDSVSQCIPLLKDMGFNSHLLGVCLSRGKDIIRKSRYAFKSCINKGFNAAYGNYFDLETKRLNLDTIKKKNSYYYLVNDCLDHNEKQEENEYFSYFQDINIHSNQSLKIDDKQEEMFGLSALSYNPKTQVLTALSDSRHTPKLFEFKMSMQNNNSFQVEPQKLIKLNPPKGKVNFFSALDPEGLILMKNGDLVISSEQQIKKKKSELILRYNFEGDLLNTIDIPEDLEERSETIKEEYEETYYVIRDNIFIDSRTGQEVARNTYESSRKPRHCVKPQCKYKKVTQKHKTKREVINQGMTYNKGLESLGITEDENYIFTANESTLIQDEEQSYKFNKEETVRIIRYDNSTQEPTFNGQFLYELEDEEDNGLVDILPLSKNKVLTLERSYDQFKNKITSRIFLVDLSNASDVTGIKEVHKAKPKIQKAKKQELVDLDEFLPLMSPGFKKLDNFEGMIFGPRLKDGSKSLILVSDNNRSVAQRTIILVLKIKQDLLSIVPN